MLRGGKGGGRLYGAVQDIFVNASEQQRGFRPLLGTAEKDVFLRAGDPAAVQLLDFEGFRKSLCLLMPSVPIGKLILHSLNP